MINVLTFGLLVRFPSLDEQTFSFGDYTMQVMKDKMDSYDESIELEQRLALAEDHVKELQKDLRWARSMVEHRNEQIQRILKKRAS